MITLKEWMELVDYRITEGSDYGWNCYGHDVHVLDSWNGDQDGHSFSVIFDTKTQTVYEVQAHDYRNQRAYRLINPEFKAAHNLEAKKRDVYFNEAWDDVDYIDLEVADDFIQKSLAIREGKDYDTRVQIQVDLEDDVLFQMMKLAHERDITFNQLVEIALQEAIDQHRMLNDDIADEYDFTYGRRGPVIQEPPFPPTNFTKEQARAAVKKAKKKGKK